MWMVLLQAVVSNLQLDIEVRSYRVYQATIIKYHRLDGLSNTNLFLTILEARKSKIKVLGPGSPVSTFPTFFCHTMLPKTIPQGTNLVVTFFMVKFIQNPFPQALWVNFPLICIYITSLTQFHYNRFLIVLQLICSTTKTGHAVIQVWNVMSLPLGRSSHAVNSDEINTKTKLILKAVCEYWEQQFLCAAFSFEFSLFIPYRLFILDFNYYNFSNQQNKHHFFSVRSVYKTGISPSVQNLLKFEAFHEEEQNVIIRW
jgi:hypothetical protein